MTIFIKQDPDVYLTESEYARYRYEYNQAYSMFAGTPPSFNSWIASKLQRSRDRVNEGILHED